MSIGASPSSGYIIPLDKALKNKIINEELNKCLIENDCKDIEELYEYTSGYLEHKWFWILRYDSDEGGPYDDLEDGMYLVFDEDVLYKSKLTKLGKQLNKMNDMPELTHWVVYA